MGRGEAPEPWELMLQLEESNVRSGQEPFLNASRTWSVTEAMSRLLGIRTCGLTFELSCPRRRAL